MIDFKFLKKRLLWIKEKTFLSVNLCFLFDCGWFHFFPDSAQPIPPPAPDTPREQLQTGLPRYLIQVSTAPNNAFATPCNLQISILAHADWRSRTSLISDVATGLASITTKHNHNNKIKYVTIFQVMDSEVTKPSVHFSMSSFKRILLIFHPTCWINLHYWNLNSPDNEWMKSHPKRSSFVAWILNYLYELTLTFIATNRNQKGSGRAQDSCRTKYSDLVAPASYHIPLGGPECQRERAPALGENPFWNCVLDCGREAGMHRWNIQESEPMITNEGQIMSSCKGRMIRLFFSTILQEDCHFVEEFFNFERRSNNDQLQRSSEEEKRETETDSMN